MPDKKIRVGLMRCDTHGMYFGPLMFKHDPLLLQRPQLDDDNSYQRESWMTGGAHFYFYTHYADASRIMVPTVEGFEIVKIWDWDRQKAVEGAKIYYNKPKVCDTIEEMSDDVDLVFIGDCNGDGSNHYQMAEPSIRKGVPTYIDKPFAYDVADARKIVDLAKKYNTPIFSRSILNEVPQMTNFKNRLFPELEDPYSAVIRFANINMAGLVHSIAICIHLFGTGVESVEAMGQDPQVFAHISYGDKPGKPKGGVTINGDSGPTYHAAAYVTAYSHLGMIATLPGVGDYEFPQGAAKILEKTKQMVLTGKPPVAYEEMIEHIAIATAIRKSIKEKRLVKLSEV